MDKPTERDLPTEDSELIEHLIRQTEILRQEIHKVVFGQEQVIEELLIALLARGHALLIGVPGLAKTLLVKTLSGVLEWEFKRIQFTPDMMPSDITGTEILQTDSETGQRVMQYVKGPIFANLVLADEINRAPPKTQAALLEAMQEYTVTAAGRTYALKRPFMVVATQNPIEHEGTYPLPEAQLDRFMFNIKVDYPDRAQEMHIVRETTSHDDASVVSVMTQKEVVAYQDLVRRIPVSKHVLAYAVDLAMASRPGPDALPFVREYVEWGVGPRASQYLILGAKSQALLRGQPAPSCKDVRDVALPVLRHRLLCNYRAAGQGIDSETVIGKLLESVKESSYTSKGIPRTPLSVVKDRTSSHGRGVSKTLENISRAMRG
ncbi:MAG: MoxR family ATPase [Planctomycetes bacterium]|nr:MoxR family ATPase [Planctomycetota bacterium]